jgi:hypothetical protein
MCLLKELKGVVFCLEPTLLMEEEIYIFYKHNNKVARKLLYTLWNTKFRC